MRWFLLVALLLAPVPARAAVDLLDWLPADTASVTGAPKDHVPFLAGLGRAVEAKAKRRPACWAKVASGADSSYQIWRAPPDPSPALLAHGRLDRAAVEACLTQSFRAVQQPVRLSREGSLTQLSGDKAVSSWLGWSAEWVIWHPDRTRVEALLAAIDARPEKPAPISGPLRRVNPATELWIASTVDYTGRFLGVPSRSTVGWLAAGPDGLSMPVAFEFRSPTEAERAAKALEARRTDESIPSAVRAALVATKASRQLHFLTLELDPNIWMTPDTMEAVGRVIGR